MATRLSTLLTAPSALLCAASLALAPASPVIAAQRDARDVREDLRFAAEMAEKGLWREALFRWRRALEARPNDPSLHNNVAVALEALGRRDDALAEYEKALALAPAERVRANYELALRALEMSKQEEPDDALAGTAPPSGEAEPGG